MISHLLRFSQRTVVVGLCTALFTTGCATVPYVGPGPNPQIERGQPFFPIDALGNVVSLPAKILLLNWKVDDHAVSERTEGVLAEYLKRRGSGIEDLKVRINQWVPVGELKRLWANKRVAWPYRLIVGLPVTLVFEILLPGRLMGGDHYNPYTNTIHLYSDLPSISVHEGAHALDFSKQRYPGTYALTRFLPFVDLYQEFKASDDAIKYFIEVEDRRDEISSYKLLYPAYGTYVGRYLYTPFNLIPVILGHLVGRQKVKEREQIYKRMDSMRKKGAS